MLKKLLLLAAVGLIAAVLPGSPASAQATRTWVSGVGDDANPCSRTAPCKTWAGAIAKTTAGGEIDALDPGGFGAVTITKAITLDGGGGIVASVLVSGTNGIVVGAGNSDVVVLRNLRINGLGTGLNGVLYLSGAQLSVDHCAIFGFTQNGISASTNTTSELYVTDTYITRSANGISMATTSAQLTAIIMNSQVFNVTTNGIYSTGTGFVDATIANSAVTSTATAISTGVNTNVFQVDNTAIVENNTAINAIAGSSVRVSRSLILGNSTNFAIGASATVASDGRNRVVPVTSPGPNGTVTLQ